MYMDWIDNNLLLCAIIIDGLHCISNENINACLFNRHLGLSVSCFTTLCLWPCLRSATAVYFAPSDVRARWSVVTRVAVKMFPWQPHHVIQTLDRFSNRWLEPQLETNYLARSWMFSRRWSPSSFVSCYSGLSPIFPIYYGVLGLVFISLQPY